MSAASAGPALAPDDLPAALRDDAPGPGPADPTPAAALIAIREDLCAATLVWQQQAMR